MSPPTPSRARWCLVFAALLFATGGPAIKSCAFSGAQVACLRSGVAALTLLAFARPPRAAFGFGALAVGVAHGATMVLFAAANKLTTATNAIFLQDSSILFVLLLAPWLLREKLRRHDAWVLVLVLAGMALLFSADQAAGASAPDPKLGNLLAGASSVTWAFTVIGMRWLAATGAGAPGRAGDAALAAVVCGNVFACLASLYPALPLHAARASDWGLVLYLGSIQIALAYAFVARGLSGVTALEATVILLIEPIVNPLLTWLVHGEEPHPLAIAGGVAILAATLSKAWWERGTAIPAPHDVPRIDSGNSPPFIT